MTRQQKITLGEMRESVVAVLLLNGCSPVDMPPTAYTAPSQPTQVAVVDGIKKKPHQSQSLALHWKYPMCAQRITALVAITSA
jgi:hypothetical protein